MQLSEKAWAMSSQIIINIKEHPFIQELAAGTLASDKFSYYIEQDNLYLEDYAKCHAILASKVPFEYTGCFLRYSNNSLITEQETVHKFFSKLFNIQKTGLISSATLSYTNHLFRNCISEPVEIGVAAILPCLWVYHDVGMFIRQCCDKNTPYMRWIEAYANDSFLNSVNEAIDIFNDLAMKASDKIRQQMLKTFYISTCLEWHFWNDAYNKDIFDNIY